MLISIVVPSLNSSMIDQVVQGLMRQPAAGHQVEALVVGRDEQQLLASLPGVRFIDTLRPVSPATARNLGVKYARGEIICFLDADCVPAQGWLQQLIAAHEAGHEVVGGGIIVEWSGYWACCDDLSAFGPYLADTQPGARTILPSLNLCISRQVLDLYGGFDEFFQRPAGEDSDLCLRLRRAGYRLYFEPTAAVYHRHSRRSLRRMLAHLYHFGAAHAFLRMRYPDMYPPGRAGKVAAGLPLLVCFAAPLLATFDIGRDMARGVLPRHYWFAFPGLILAKSAWYVGLATTMRTDAYRAQRVRMT